MIWRTDRTEEEPVQVGSTNYVVDLEFDPASQRVVTISQVGFGRIVRMAEVWDAVTGKLLRPSVDPEAIVTDAHFLSTGDLLTVAATRSKS